MAALTAGAIWLASGSSGDGKKSHNKDKKIKGNYLTPTATPNSNNDSFDNDNTRFGKENSNISGFDWEAWNNDNTKFDNPNSVEPSAPPYWEVLPESEWQNYQ